MRNYSFGQLLRLLLTAVACCILLRSNHTAVKAHQGENQDKEDWAEIDQLYQRGRQKRLERNFGDSEEIFRQAVRKLEQYRSHYIKDQNSLSFLRATDLLGKFSEWGNMDKEARAFYTAALSIRPPTNSVRESSEVKLITQEVGKRLSIVKRRISRKATSKDYPRISVKGGSKGGARDVPKFEMLFRP